MIGKLAYPFYPYKFLLIIFSPTPGSCLPRLSLRAQGRSSGGSGSAGLEVSSQDWGATGCPQDSVQLGYVEIYPLVN